MQHLWHAHQAAQYLAEVVPAFYMNLERDGGAVAVAVVDGYQLDIGFEVGDL